MKILFSVFNEDRRLALVDKIFSKKVETDWTIEQIELHLNLSDGFRSSIVAGYNLCFWDIYLFTDISQKVIEQIDNISVTSTPFKTEDFNSKFVVVSEFGPENDYIPPSPNWNQYFLYDCYRYECGASGLGAVFIEIIDNPWVQGILGNFIWELLKISFKKIFHLKTFEQNPSNKNIYYFSMKKFYKNFSVAVNMKKTDFQIISLKRIKMGNFKVFVRTDFGDYYDVRCTFKGRIISLDLIEWRRNNE